MTAETQFNKIVEPRATYGDTIFCKYYCPTRSFELLDKASFGGGVAETFFDSHRSEDTVSAVANLPSELRN